MSILKKVIIFILVIMLMILTQNITLAAQGTVNTETLNVRKEPSTDSSILKLLDRNQKVEILEESGDWYKINSDGVTGYVSKKYIKTEDNIPESNTPENDAPGDDTPANTVDEGTSDNPDIIDDNQTNTSDMEMPAELKMTKEIDIYVLPLINSIKISKTVVGETVDIVSVTENWVYISSSKANGWVIKSKMLDDSNNSNNNQNEEKPNNTQTSETKIEEKTMYVNANSIYVRKGPGTNYEVVDSLILNSQVIVTAENGDWYKVKVSGLEGYISKKLLSSSKKETTSRGESERTVAQVSDTVQSEESLVEYAKQFLGCDYSYGGAGPTTFDCSGFTMYVYSKYGVNLSHSAIAQSKSGTYVAKEDLIPGDLVFFKDYQTMDGIGHCGIYIGNGDFIHASSGTGDCVKISTLLTGSYEKRYETARRVL